MQENQHHSHITWEAILWHHFLISFLKLLRELNLFTFTGTVRGLDGMCLQNHDILRSHRVS